MYSLTENLLGNYTCQITNIYGTAERIFNVSAKPSLEIIEPVIDSTKYFIGDNISIRCRSINIPETPKKAESIFNERPHNQFLWRFTPDETKESVYLSVSKYRGKIFEIYTELQTSIMISHSTLTIWKAQFEYQGRYVCARMINNKVVRAYIDIKVKGVPTVTTNSSELAVLPGQTGRLHCNVTARPAADDVEWFIDGIPVHIDRRKYDIISSASDIYQTSTLVVKRVKMRDYDVQYSCRAENEIGAKGLNLRLKDVNECETGHHNCTKEGFICRDIIGSFACDCKHGYVQDRGTCIVLSNKAAESFAVIVGVSIGVTVVAVIVIVVLVCFFRKKRKQDTTEPLNTHMVARYNISNNSNMTTHEPSEKLQIDTDLFPRSRLKFLNNLGEGKFGKVLKAEALSISKSGMWETVAVKMWKDSSTDGEKEDFYNELMIVKKIPAHHNVVSFLGRTPAEGSNSALMIMEYVPGGDLLTYLRKLRTPKQVNTPSTEPSIHSQLSPKELLRFSHQIAKGMVHIASLHIVHRDVAARNILIGENNICKISDFGLARETEGTDEYERCTKGPLPIRWMSIESLRDNLHTIKSDVWSYGVCLWEIATLGASPYPGKSAKMAMESILTGDRLECPTHCKKEVYDIMGSCWADDATCRPSFEDLMFKLEGLLEDEGEYMMLDNFDEQVYSVIDDVRHEERL
ncbi:fibroblast growth factor receptor 2 [Patella vulgata]|uniref:fibroblast growth factor receptor 2 n=1 Tax=Patella vulgata TaxID=6465 RepID=UPI0024A940C5|nr:fibroblast growth factor receptor 2 [Patella vulgata]